MDRSGEEGPEAEVDACALYVRHKTRSFTFSIADSSLYLGSMKLLSINRDLLIYHPSHQYLPSPIGKSPSSVVPS
jgi:hypothetical protein